MSAILVASVSVGVEQVARSLFGILKRDGRVYTVVVKGTKKDTLIPIITSNIKPDSVVYTDTDSSYNTLNVSDFKHLRINHSKEFANNHNHIKAQENFWRQSKRVLAKYNGIEAKTFIF